VLLIHSSSACVCVRVSLRHPTAEHLCRHPRTRTRSPAP
jgi:hypothetical protein